MAGLLDFLLGGGAGLLGGSPAAYAGPGSMNFGAGDPSNAQRQFALPQFSPQMAQPQAQDAMAQGAAPPASPMQATADGGIGMGGGIKSGLFNMLAAMNPAAANAVIQRQMKIGALQSLPGTMPMAQKLAVLQNPKVQEAIYGNPQAAGEFKFGDVSVPNMVGGGRQMGMASPGGGQGGQFSLANMLQLNDQLQQRKAQIGAYGDNLKQTPDQKNAGVPDQTGIPGVGARPASPTLGQPLGAPGTPTSGNPVLDFKSKEKDMENDSGAYQKDFTGLQSTGRNAIVGAQQAKLLKQLTQDPNFYSGPVSDYVKTYRQFQSVLGDDPGKATPAELFTKVANNMLQEQIKSMGQSGVGRVLQAEVNIMRQATASMDNTPQGNRALAEILSRTYQHQQDIANIARGIQAPPGQRSAALNAAVDDYLKANPLFKPEEMQNPKLLGAPEAPPQAAKWSPQQARSWAQGLGLRQGDPVRINGQLGAVP